LRHLRLTISWGADDDLLRYTVQGANHLIRVNDCLRLAPRQVLEGGIVHKLCHVDADIRIAPFQRELAWLKYGRSRWCRMREERGTEVRVIELGYGASLLAFVGFARRLG
jgi:hypothetical protein